MTYFLFLENGKQHSKCDENESNDDDYAYINTLAANIIFILLSRWGSGVWALYWVNFECILSGFQWILNGFWVKFECDFQNHHHYSHPISQLDSNFKRWEVGAIRELFGANEPRPRLVRHKNFNTSSSFSQKEANLEY